MTPGQRIELRRKQLQLSQGDLAKLLDTQQTQISRIELDTQPGRKHLAKIAEKLQVPVSWITTGLPLQPWEWKNESVDLLTLRSNVAAAMAHLQQVITELDQAIAPSKAAPFPDAGPSALESDLQNIQDGVQLFDGPRSDQPAVEHPQRSPRRPRRTGGAS